MTALYRLGVYPVFWLAFPLLTARRKTREGLKQRLGVMPSLATAPRPRIWLHGASAGDVLALSPIVLLLRESLPGATLVLTTFTDSGRAMAKRRLSGALDGAYWAPYDLPGATRRATAALRPDLLVLEYAELWPNLIQSVKRSGAKVALTNGHLSERRMDGYRRLFRVAGNPLQAIDRLMMRTEVDAERARRLAAPEERVVVLGNTKHDALVPRERHGAEGPNEASPGAGDAPRRAALGFQPEVKLWVAGSTHEGEEALLLEAFSVLLESHPTLRLLIAPRYVQRAEEVVTLARARGLSVRRRSATCDGRDAPQVTVVDTVGELSWLYGLAHFTFVGGSFVPRGGQNPLEPAARAKPVLYGPGMENFVDAVEALEGRGGTTVESPQALIAAARRLLDDPGRAFRLGREAAEVVRGLGGATARVVDELMRLLPRGAATSRREAPR